MAADTYEAPSFKTPAVFSRSNSAPIVRAASVDFDSLVGAAGSTIASGLLEDNDSIKWFKLPPDVKILYGRVDSEDHDSGSGLVWDLVVTDGTTTKYIFNGGTIGQGAGFVDSREAAGTGVVNKFTTDSAIGYVIPGEGFYVAYNVTTAPAGTGSADGLAVEVGYISALEAGEAVARS